MASSSHDKPDAKSDDAKSDKMKCPQADSSLSLASFDPEFGSPYAFLPRGGPSMAQGYVVGGYSGTMDVSIPSTRLFSGTSSSSPSVPASTTPSTSPFENNFNWDDRLVGEVLNGPIFGDMFATAFDPTPQTIEARHATSEAHSLGQSLPTGPCRASSPTGQPKTYKCEVPGCSAVFTTSRRDYERHMDGVHGPPVTLRCGAVCKNRKDNIKRHEKKCPKCKLLSSRTSRRSRSRSQSEGAGQASIDGCSNET